MNKKIQRFNGVGPFSIINKLASDISTLNAIDYHAICSEIGCSSLEPEMCASKQYLCEIIRKIVKSSSEEEQP